VADESLTLIVIDETYQELSRRYPDAKKYSKIRRQIAMLKKRGADGNYQIKELELSLNTPRNIEYLYNLLIHYAKGCR